jgi:hypothetical protein
MRNGVLNISVQREKRRENALSAMNVFIEGFWLLNIKKQGVANSLLNTSVN